VAPGVSEAVEAESWASVAGAPAKELVADGVGVEPCAVGLVEHEAVISEVGGDK
jgi:hypothetical protein